MSSKAEIEAQIAALQAQLREAVTYDPAFTPAELVRWDPSLIGTAFRIQHELDIPANALTDAVTYKGFEGTRHHDIQFENPSNVYTGSREWMMAHRDEISTPILKQRIGNIGILTSSGTIAYLTVSIIQNDFYKYDNFMKQIEINDFNEFTIYRAGIAGQLNDGVRRSFGGTPPLSLCGDISFESLGITILKKTVKPITTTAGETNHVIHTYIYELPLANPSRPPLDQIYIANHIQLPYCGGPTHLYEPLVTVDKYPLSTLYQEWKRDKAAGRMHRHTPLDEAMSTIRALQEELRLAREARTASEAHSEKLRLALYASAGIKDSENPV